jgi:arylsulfatase A-like enzyme
MCVLAAGCDRTERPPSIVLAVFDTTRADAVSAYGEVAGTTPTVDALARAGLRYSHAYSNANWTLPAHASLFTGLVPSEHGVRLAGDALPDSIPTLAEHLRRRGYETVAVSENPWLSDGTRMTRGFDRFIPLDVWGLGVGPDMSDVVGDWLHARQGDRPFLLFLNVMNAHLYRVGTINPFLPPGVSGEDAARVSQWPRDYLCIKRPGDPALAVLWGLYLGGVQAADAKLARVLGRLEAAHATDHLILIVTSDHGECFGEHGLFRHDIGIGEPLVHIPLIVHGLRDVSPAIIEAPVALTDILPTVLGWAGAPVPDGTAGRPLPTQESATVPPRAIVAEYRDALSDDHVAEEMRTSVVRRRINCGPTDRVYGDMRAVVRFPHKLVWYSNYSPELFDVRADPLEEHDLSTTLPTTVAALAAELKVVERAAKGEPARSTSHLDPALVKQLRALGYLGE